MGVQLISYTAYELATSDTSDDDVYGVSYGREEVRKKRCFRLVEYSYSNSIPVLITFC